MDTGQPPVLETAKLLGKGYLLGQERSRSDSAESRKNLRGPVYLECLRRICGRGNRRHSSQAVALRRVRGCAAPLLFFGAPGTRSSDPAACLCAASPHRQRMCGGFVPGAGLQIGSLRGTGNNGSCRAVTERPESLDVPGLSGRARPRLAGRGRALSCLPGGWHFQKTGRGRARPCTLSS